MSEGFVYVLLNPSFPDQVKIGLTKQESETRAKALQSTGVPTPFIVVYDELVTDCEAVESRVHTRLAGYRVSNDREFFRLPVREAIRALQEEATAFRISSLGLSSRVDILSPLMSKYGSYLRPDTAAVAIVQLSGVCFLEITRRKCPQAHDEVIERLDLSFIVHRDQEMFPTTAPVQENAKRFIDEMDAYSLIMTTDLFTEESCKKIAHEWEVGRR